MPNGGVHAAARINATFAGPRFDAKHAPAARSNELHADAIRNVLPGRMHLFPFVGSLSPHPLKNPSAITRLDDWQRRFIVAARSIDEFLGYHTTRNCHEFDVVVVSQMLSVKVRTLPLGFHAISSIAQATSREISPGFPATLSISGSPRHWRFESFVRTIPELRTGAR